MLPGKLDSDRGHSSGRTHKSNYTWEWHKRHFYILVYLAGKFCGCFHKFLFLICKLKDMMNQEVKKKRPSRNDKGISYQESTLPYQLLCSFLGWCPVYCLLWFDWFHSLKKTKIFKKQSHHVCSEINKIFYSEKST